jgi:hypothetical protein
MLRLIRTPESQQILTELVSHQDIACDASPSLRFGQAGLGHHSAAVPLASCFGSNLDQQLHAQFHALLGRFFARVDTASGPNISWTVAVLCCMLCGMLRFFKPAGIVCCCSVILILEQLP